MEQFISILLAVNNSTKFAGAALRQDSTFIASCSNPLVWLFTVLGNIGLASCPNVKQVSSETRGSSDKTHAIDTIRESLGMSFLRQPT